MTWVEQTSRHRILGVVKLSRQSTYYYSGMSRHLELSSVERCLKMPFTERLSVLYQKKIFSVPCTPATGGKWAPS
jgi:hypothetical protein